jgi:Fe2+ or Zn2+ uptake regulation protein
MGNMPERAGSAATGRDECPPGGRYRVECRECGISADAGGAIGEQPLLRHPPGAGGFTIENVEVIFRGICSACRERRPDVATRIRLVPSEKWP